MSSLRDAFQTLLAVLDRLEIRFLVGGSVASSLHGLPRQTNDIDIVVDLRPEVVRDLCDSLRPAFFADQDYVRRAVAEGRSFNLIHMTGAYKFDLFPVGGDQFALSELDRRQYATASLPGLEDVEFPVASAEDTILAKLAWYRRGGEVSDRQWGDLLGMRRIQGARLDQAYLKFWAAHLGVADLLAKLDESPNS